MLIRLLTAVALTLLAPGSRAEGAPKPNIVLIVGDDHGYLDFGFMGSAVVRTPNLDRLAAQGTVFTHGYATASICRPSLQSLLTGLHPIQWNARLTKLARHGIRRGPYAAIQDFDTLPRLLAEEGYASFQAGKYGYASFEQAGFTDGMQHMGDPVEYGGSGQRLGRDGIDPVYAFIDAHLNEPFFLWFAPMLPHAPHDAGPRYHAFYEGVPLSDSTRAYYANITRFDDVVGQLIEFLELRKLVSRTLVVYMVDNGWDQGPHVRPTPDARGSFDGGRGKRSTYELGFRSPIIFHAPGLVPAGRVYDELVSSVDLFPTLLEYAGANPRPDRPGQSLVSLLSGSRRDWRSRPVIGAWASLAPGAAGRRTRGVRYVGYFARTPQWRYVWDAQNDTRALYEIERDPREEHDVLDENFTIAARLHDLITQWRRQMSVGWLRDRTGPENPVASEPEAPATPGDPTLEEHMDGR